MTVALALMLSLAQSPTATEAAAQEVHIVDRTPLGRMEHLDARRGPGGWTVSRSFCVVGNCRDDGGVLDGDRARKLEALLADPSLLTPRPRVPDAQTDCGVTEVEVVGRGAAGRLRLSGCQADRDPGIQAVEALLKGPPFPTRSP